MFRNRNFIKAMTAAALCGTALTAGLQVPLTVEAVSAATTQLHIIPGKEEATVNGAASSLEEPAALIEDSIYVPARWLAEQLGLQLNWNETSRTVGLLTSKGYIEFNPDGDTVSVNGNRTAFEGSAAIRHDRLLVKLSWIAPWLDIAYKYDESTRGVAIQFLGQVSTAYKESDLTAEDMQINSRPIAKFAFDKPVYRLGEPVKIVDLSYDPDAEGLPDYEWTGKAEAYFEPGTYTVTLKVKDGKGNESEPFTKSVQVTDAPYLSKADFPYYAKPEGSVFAYDSAVIPVLSGQDQEKKAGPAVPVLVRQPKDRPLLRGMSTEPVTESGFLFRGEINGQARLYPSYVNGLTGKAQLSIVLRNKDDKKPVKVTTTRKSLAAPSVYNPVRAYKTLEEFMTAQPSEDEVTVGPGEEVIYAASPELSPGQGFQNLYDLQTDGPLDVSYLLTPPGLKPYDIGRLEQVGFNSAADASGTFPVSEVSWNIDARPLKDRMSLTIGDDQVEPVLQGMNPATRQEAQHPGYAGVHYRIELTSADSVALALHARGGFFQGAVKVNGQAVELPEAGLTDKEALLLHRTKSKQADTVVIELMAADRTQLPVELLAIPLEAK